MANVVDTSRLGEQYLDMLRDILADFPLATAAVHGQREAEIRAAVAAAELDAQREWDTLTAAAREARDREHAAAQQEFAALRAALERRRAAALDQLERERRIARTTIASHYNEAVAEARLEREDRVLLANTVAPATIKGHARDLQRLEQALEQLSQRCDELRSRVDAASRRFRVDCPDDAGVAPPAEECSAVECVRRAETAVETLEALRLPNLLSGATPYAIGGLVVIVLTATGALLSRFAAPLTMPVAGGLGAATALILLALLGRRLGRRANQQAGESVAVALSRLAAARAAIDRQRSDAQARFRKAEVDALARRDREVREADEHHKTATLQAQRERDGATQRIVAEFQERQRAIELRHATRLRLAQERCQQRTTSADRALAQSTRGADSTRDARVQRTRAGGDSAQAALRRDCDRGAAGLRRLVETTHELRIPRFDWHAPDGLAAWKPASGFVANVPFAWLELDLSQLAASARSHLDGPVSVNGHLRIPAILALPTRGSLLIEAPREARQAAIDLLRCVIVRILTTLPPGQAHFTIFDPVGLGENFAGLMHLVDYREALLGGRIWTEREHIESRLGDLTAHMETVIQKYLRNEFDTIAAYNEHAGELAEPYRFLVIADYPAAFSDTAIERLLSIIRSGGRCGVFTLIVCDPRQPGSSVPLWDDLRERSMHLAHTGDGFRFADDVLHAFPLVVDRPPSEHRLTEIMHAVGREARANLRVEVPFESIAPRPEEYWAASAAAELRVPIGRSGAARLQHFRLGHGLAQHALIAGKTGSGKSTLLHVLVTNLALAYSPGEVEFYLVDFKKGVEFKTYATHGLPHARAIAIESDREFGLSVLQRIDAEMHRRGELFRQAGVQDLAAYRATTGAVLPRTLLIVDEFQVFFGEDDRLAQEAGILLDRIVRQGRAFGIHVVLGSQTLAGNVAMARSTLGQMAVRIALQCAEADAQLILDDSNTAARLLVRPGEAIYNDAGGLVAGNNPFQTAWLSDERRAGYLAKIADLAGERHVPVAAPVVFEGNVPADIRANPLLAAAVRGEVDPSAPLRAWLGEPVAIKDPTSAAFPRQPGAHLLVIGQQDRSAMAVMSAALVSLAAQRDPAALRFVVLDGSPDDRREASGLARVAASLPHAIDPVRYRDAADAVCAVADEVRRRLDGSQPEEQSVFLVIHGLQRYRALRRGDDEFSFSVSAEAPAARPDQELAFILREGPGVGVHVLAWCDTLSNLERALERSALREFDNRLLFQMSATDSSHLIDSPEANNLGLHRALLYSEERGLIEKLRPYDELSAAWLAQVAAALRGRTRPG